MTAASYRRHSGTSGYMNYASKNSRRHEDIIWSIFRSILYVIELQIDKTIITFYKNLYI